MVKGFSFLSSESSRPSDSTFCPALTLRIIPNAIQVIQAAVPPLLINGSVCPVTGKTCKATAIFTKAWMMMGNPRPKTKSFPYTVSDLWAMTTILDDLGNQGRLPNHPQLLDEILEQKRITTNLSSWRFPKFLKWWFRCSLRVNICQFKFSFEAFTHVF